MKKVFGILLVIIGAFFLLGGTVTFFKEANFSTATPQAAGELTGRLMVPLIGLGILLLGLKFQRKINQV
jgi:multisubunit Na+/H+ antiporter MnhG subunit